MNYTSYTEDFVKELYYRIGILRPQKLDFGVISYKMGIDVFYWNKPSQALFLNEFAWIFLNNHLSPQQIWQDFCHELGHVLLHVFRNLKVSHFAANLESHSLAEIILLA
ncbi:ImmA/IrrE family metallo-endopeptidase [Ureibacillus sp. MALMAid1270]|uniref:ImmA/IrrE family metallo-endopeptidase n=1 Tax=Ureibacillus sp. MALMAid1270 TaxID=3411629 RepID=UPI003BA48FA6